MRNKILAAAAAGGLLIGVGAISAIISSPGVASAQEDTAKDDKEAPARHFDVLGEVLDELVGDGTITQDQADAITDALTAKTAELREQHQAQRELLKGLFEDGVLTEEEASQLPDDHWLKSDVFDEAWEDGELTRDEIREIRPHPRLDAFRRGFRFGSELEQHGDGA